MKFSNLFAVVTASLPILASALAISETTERSLASFGKRSTVSEIWSAIEGAATCTACEVSKIHPYRYRVVLIRFE